MATISAALDEVFFLFYVLNDRGGVEVGSAGEGLDGRLKM
jgi:hypothetical protein